MLGFKKAMAALRSALSVGLNEQQTAPRSQSMASLLNYNAITTLSPAELAQAFTAADQGYIMQQARLFQLIEERDSHIYAELNKRKLAVTGLEWYLEPPRDASQSELDHTAELTDMIKSINDIEDAQFDMTDAIGKGIVMSELIWKQGETWLPEKIEYVPQRLFQTDRDTQQILYLNRGVPEPLQPFKWLVHEHRAKSGYIEQTALFRVLAWTYAYKAYTVKDMMRFLELYGLPLRLGKYPSGIDSKQRNELLKAVMNIGNDGAGIIPNTMMVDFIQTQPGKVDDFLQNVQYWESKQSKAILGGELDGKTSSEARIILYDKIRKEFVYHDAKQLEPSYSNGLVKPIALINGLFPEDRLPRWRYNTEENADQKLMVDVLEKAVNIGMEVDIDEAHRLLQIPRAKEGAKVLSVGGQVNAKSALRAALTNQHPQPETIQDNMVQQLTQLSMQYEQAQQDLIAGIVAEAGDIESAITQVGALNLNKSPIYKGWKDLITKGMVAANLAGCTEEKHEDD